MTTLILIRHAKSEWDVPPGSSDHDRPLNARGARDAPAMADRLAATEVSVDALLTSTAARARATADAFAARLGLDPEPHDDLYGAAPATILERVRARDVPSVIVVAHDPGLSMLAASLSGEGIGHMPTCAVATFTWDTDDWEVATATDPATWELRTPRGD